MKSKIKYIALMAIQCGLWGATVYAIQVPSSEAGCTWTNPPSFCQTSNISCERDDVASGPGGTQISDLKGTNTTDNCQKGNGSRPAKITGSYTFAQTYNISLAPGISGGEEVKASLNATLGYSSAETFTSSSDCACTVGECQSAYIELRIKHKDGMKAKVDHSYHCTMTVPSVPVGARCYGKGGTYNSSSCTGKTSTALGNKFVEWYCPTPAYSNCKNCACTSHP